MKITGKKSIKLVLLTLFWLACLLSTTYAANVTIGLPEKFQEHSQWCWAGTSQSVLSYYRTSVNQCAMANFAWSRSDCCGNTNFNWSHACNQPNSMYSTSGSLQAILTRWGVNSTPVDRSLTWSEIVTEINARRPFVMRFGWTSGGGHFLNGYGYDDASPTYVHYMDPWPGNGYAKSTFSYTTSSSNHRWTHTLRITTTPPSPAPAAPSLTAPANGATVSGTTITFSWTSSGGATTYWLELNTSSSFGSGTRAYYSSVGNTTSKTLSGFPNNGRTYYWRVWAGNSTGWSSASASRSFINGSGTGPPAAPSLTAPANGATVSGTTITFSWSSSGGATTYWLELNTSSSFGSGTRAYYSSVGNATSKTLSGFPNNGRTYYWRVWAGNSSGWSSASASRSFINGSGTTAGFEEHFRTRPANWLPDSGAWSIASNEYWYTAGINNAWSLSTYNANFGNLDYSARIWRNSNDRNWASGLVFRASGSILSNGRFSNYYWFAISREGRFSLWKIVGNTETAVKYWAASSAINSGSAWNTLRVVASDSNITCYINGTLVWSGSDASLSSGRVGVGMYRGEGSTADGFWVDWARLSIPSRASAVSDSFVLEQEPFYSTNMFEAVFQNSSGAGNAAPD